MHKRFIAWYKSLNNSPLFTEYPNRILHSIVENKIWIGYLALISLLAYFYTLTSFSLTIDEECFVMSHKLVLGAVQEGRWAIGLLNLLLLPNPVMPFVPLFLTLFFTAISFSLVAKIFAPKKSFAPYLAAPLFIASPILFSMFCFNAINFAIGFAFLSAALSVYLFVSKKPYAKAFAVLFAVFSVGIYQVMISWIAVIFLLYFLNFIINGEKITLQKLLILLMKIILFLIVVGLIDFAVIHLSYFLMNTKDSGYISGFIQISYKLKYWLMTFKILLRQMGKYYSGSSSIYFYNLRSLMLLSLSVFFIVLLQILHSKQNRSVKLFGGLFLVILFLMPFAFNLINAGVMPVRSLFGVPLVLSGLTILSWKNSANIVKTFLLLLVIVISFKFMVINHKFAYANNLNYDADKTLSIRIFSRIDSIRPLVKNSISKTTPPIPLVVVGYSDRRSSEYLFQKEMIGASFYHVNIVRIVYFLNTMGIFEFTPATLEQKKAIMPIATKLPSWPDRGSVAFINGIAVVKFSDYSEP